MRSRAAWLVAAALALGACTVEHGNRQAAGAAPGPGGSVPPGGTVSPGTGAMPGATHTAFDSLREHVAIGVDRISISMLLGPEAGRASQQAAMQAVADAERRADPTLAAIRVLGFLPPPAGHGEHPSGMRMIPFAILTWEPDEGWNAVSAASLHAPHASHVLFVTDLPNHQPVPGAGTGR